MSERERAREGRGGAETERQRDTERETETERSYKYIMPTDRPSRRANEPEMMRESRPRANKTRELKCKFFNGSLNGECAEV